ncbi:ROK family protein [Kribbella sp. NBC_01245]|uniref:ROK family transcriptional regulator n=1 Tax=Kribbella sp. NBC_01245 TaxID=2903578 RepID=UPI002E2837F4|nr:ROK family transcriptional regulator [Kribbella sp. NBC_01245]
MERREGQWLMGDVVGATPPLLRRVNAGKVLSVLSAGGVQTGSDLIESTGLTRATVHAVCNDLIAMGWVRELGTGREAGTSTGRPSRRFEFNSRAGYVLGIDMGAGKTTVLVADLRGEVLGKAVHSFRDVQLPATERTGVVDRAATEALASAGVRADEVLAVGVGVAAPVSRDGKILDTDKFWRAFDVGLDTTLTKLHGWRVLIENDANLAALGERWRGTASGVDDLAVVLSGERIGAGLLESGRLLHGHRGGAGEMVYLELVEGVGSADGIARLAREWGAAAITKRSPRTALRKLAGGLDAVTAEMVFAAAADGDAVAQDILDRLSTRMARVIASVGVLLNPELVVIGGAVAEAAGVLVPGITAQLPSFTTSPPRVAVSSLGDAIVSVGAVRHALNHVEANALDIALPTPQPSAN